MKFVYATLFILLFFVWGTFSDLFILVRIYWPFFHKMCAVGFVIALVLYAKRHLLRRQLNLFVKWQFVIFPSIAFVIATVIAVFVFEKVPHVQDGIHYWLMAEQFVEGRMTIPRPLFAPFIDYIFLLPLKGGLVSLFPPGFSLFLAPFMAVGLPWLASPVATGINTLLVGKIAIETTKNRNISAFAMVLTLLSPFLMIMGGASLAHPFCALLMLLTVWVILIAVRRERLFWASGAGFALGWCLVTRPYNAFALFVGLTPLLLFYFPLKKVLRIALWGFVGIAPWLLFALFYSRYYTGEFFTPVQTLFFNATEPIKNCSRPGLGKGCPFTNGFVMDPGGFSLHNAFFVSYERLRQLLVHFFTQPFIFLFIALAPLAAKNSDERKGAFFALTLFLSIFVAYFFFYFNGNAYGPRYYYEVSFLLMIPLSITFIRVWTLSGTKRWHLPLSLLVATFFIGTLLTEARYILPGVLKNYNRDYWLVGPGLRDELADKKIEKALVFVAHSRDKYDAQYGNALLAMNLFQLEEGNIIVHDFGLYANNQMIHRFPNRATFLAVRVDQKRWKLLPIVNSLPPETVKIELENSRLTIERENRADYCNVYPVFDPAVFYISVPNKLFQHTPWKGLLCHFSQHNQSYKLHYDFLLSGERKGLIRYLAGPNLGTFTVELNGKVIVDISGNSPVYLMREREFTAEVKQGDNLLTIRPKGAADNLFVSDFIRFF